MENSSFSRSSSRAAGQVFEQDRLFQFICRRSGTTSFDLRILDQLQIASWFSILTKLTRDICAEYDYFLYMNESGDIEVRIMLPVDAKIVTADLSNDLTPNNIYAELYRGDHLLDVMIF